MTWRIDKTFSFCYGHRVWTQKLNEDYCAVGDTQCKCRHLHGHEGLVHVFLESEELDRGMVTDFKHLGWLKDFIDNTLDHKFIIDQNDPMFEGMVWEMWKESSVGWMHLIKDDVATLPIHVSGTGLEVGRVFNLELVEKDSPQYEVLEGYFIVDFTPTSENLCKWLYDVVQAKMKLLGINVAQVDWFETPKSRSSYRPE